MPLGPSRVVSTAPCPVFSGWPGSPFVGFECKLFSMLLGLDKIFPWDTTGQLSSCSPPSPKAGAAPGLLICASLVFGDGGPFPFLLWAPWE